MAPRLVGVIAGTAGAVLLVGAMARSWAVASFPPVVAACWPDGFVELGTTTNRAAFWQVFGWSVPFGVSVVLAVVVTAVAVVLAPRHVRTAPFAVAVGLVAGGCLWNFVERVLAGSVVDYVAVCFADGGYAVVNVPDVAIVAGVATSAVLVFGRPAWRERQ